MRPFKMFFGLSLAIMLFLFVARFLVLAFIAAAIMSIVYAVFRRLKDFITYDRFGDHYIKGYDHHPSMRSNWNTEVEPLFHGNEINFNRRNDEVRFVDIH